VGCRGRSIRHITLDAHEDYVVIGGVNAHLEKVLLRWRMSSFSLQVTMTVLAAIGVIARCPTANKMIMYCLERPIGTTHLQKVDSAFQALSAGGLAHPGQC
jgi:hypothetical protein